MQVNMQFLADALQKTCEKYLKHGEVRFDKNEETGEEHINFENIMKTALKGFVQNRYADMAIIDSTDDLDDDIPDCIKYIPIDNIRNFYYNLPWTSIMCYYENKKLYGVFIFDSMDQTVLFCNTRDDDKNVRVYRNFSVNNFRARKISRGLYNISDVTSTEELEIVTRKQPKKIISFFSPTLAMLSVIKGNLDGMAAKVDNRALVQPICLMYNKLGVTYAFKNDIISVV